jgi:hypothetical protein
VSHAWSYARSVRYCVYSTSITRGPRSEGIIAGSALDDSRPLWIADGVQHAAGVGDAWTLCGLSTEGLHRFIEHDFESVSISEGACRDCAAAATEHDAS